MSRDFPVTGLKELDAVLSALPKKMQKQAYRRALTAAARPIRDEARMRAPKKSGKMAKSIKTGSPRQNPDGSFSVQIRPDGEHGFLALFHEYGTSPHFIAPGDAAQDGKGLSARLLTRKAKRGDVTGEVATGRLKIGQNYVTGPVFHPGHSAQPFMRPALDIRADDAVAAFAKVIREFLEYNTGFSSPLDEAA